MGHHPVETNIHDNPGGDRIPPLNLAHLGFLCFIFWGMELQKCNRRKGMTTAWYIIDPFWPSPTEGKHADHVGALRVDALWMAC